MVKITSYNVMGGFDIDFHNFLPHKRFVFGFSNTINIDHCQGFKIQNFEVENLNFAMNGHTMIDDFMCQTTIQKNGNSYTHPS
jgi:hypothetical protein